eukprot:3396901-Pyramimonas_sp.AAC.1
MAVTMCVLPHPPAPVRNIRSGCCAHLEPPEAKVVASYVSKKCTAVSNALLCSEFIELYRSSSRWLRSFASTTGMTTSAPC